MKKIFKLMANMLAIATFALVFTSCNEDENNASSNTVEVSSITVEPKSIYLEVDATQTLTATLLPADASTDSIIWSTYNKEVATIRPTGALTAEITGVSIGTTTITIVTSNNKRAICEVTVSKTIPLVDITVKPTGPLHLESGIRQQIIATQGPANATNYHPVWTSSDPSVVSVEGNGIIFTEGAGTAIITVTSGTVSKNIEILVTDPLSSITITPEGLLYLTEIGNTTQLTDVPVPASPKDYNPVWTSTNTGVVTVTKTGFVTAISAGTAKIIVASGNIADTIDVKVTSAILSDIILTPDTEVSITTGVTKQLNATAVPETAENYVLTYTSNNVNVATVSQTGLITGVGSGNAIITVSSGDVKKSVTVFVNVVKFSPSEEGWTITSRNPSHNWRPDGGNVDGAGQPQFVIDGDKTTGFHSSVSSSLPQVLVVDMKSPATVARVIIWHVEGGLSKGWLYYNDIQIYLSNSPVAATEYQDSWGDPVGVHKYTGGYDPVTIDLATNSYGQYLIVDFLTSTNNSYISFGELEVYGAR